MAAAIQVLDGCYNKVDLAAISAAAKAKTSSGRAHFTSVLARADL